MKIVINSEKDLNKFYKRIWLYRTRIFYFANFSYESNKYNLDEIIYALNIKNKYERLKYVYEKTLDQIDSFYKNKNICSFKNGVCKKGLTNGCCRFCIYVTDKGCPSGNIACKMHNCSLVTCINKVLVYQDLKLLKCLTIRQQYILKNDYFSLEEDVLKDLKYNSLFIACIRMYYRLIKNTIKKKRIKY